MKILLVMPQPPERAGAGGLAAYLYAALSGLVEEGHDVTVVTAAGPGDQERAAASELERQGYDIVWVPRHMGADRWRRRMRMAMQWGLRGQPWRTVWFSEPGVQEALSVLFANRSFDIVDVHDNSMAGYRFSTTAPVVLTEVEVRRARSIQWRPGGPSEWGSWALREVDWARWPQYQRTTWARFDAVRVFTARDAAAAVAIAPDISPRLHVTPFGITVPQRRGGMTTDDATVVFLGDYTHEPNIDAAFWLANEIFPHVVAQVPEARLLLAGPHAPESIRGLESPNVHVLGLVADADALLQEATVVAAPVRIGGGMRVKVLHALALGKALVTTSKGTDGLEKFGPLPLVVEDDAEGLAAAIVRLLLDCEERERLGLRALDFVARDFTPQAFARRSTAVYANVIERVSREEAL